MLLSTTDAAYRRASLLPSLTAQAFAAPPLLRGPPSGASSQDGDPHVAFGAILKDMAAASRGTPEDRMLVRKTAILAPWHTGGCVWLLAKYVDLVTDKVIENFCGTVTQVACRMVLLFVSSWLKPAQTPPNTGAPTVTFCHRHLQEPLLCCSSDDGGRLFSQPLLDFPLPDEVSPSFIPTAAVLRSPACLGHHSVRRRAVPAKNGQPARVLYSQEQCTFRPTAVVRPMQPRWRVVTRCFSSRRLRAPLMRCYVLIRVCVNATGGSVPARLSGRRRFGRHQRRGARKRISRSSYPSITAALAMLQAT